MDGEIDTLFPAGLHDLPVTFETEDRAEALFRRGVCERSQTDVVYLLTKTGHHVFKRVTRSPDDLRVTENLAGFKRIHVLFSQVYPVGIQFKGDVHVVIDKEQGPVTFANLFHGASDAGKLFPVSLFHP